MSFIHEVLGKYTTSDIKVTHDEDDLKIELKGVGTASGVFAYIDDETYAMEYPPLSLDSYGKEEGERIYKLIENDEHIFYINIVEVDSSQRSKGYGKLLMNALENEAKKKNIDAIMANASPMGDVQVPFSTLKKFYIELGYKFLTIYQNSNGLIYKKV